MEEKWVYVGGYEDRYMISSWGRVKSIERINEYGRRIRERILKPGLAGKGYMQVNFWNKGRQIHKKIHRLVAETFIAGRKMGYEVNHIDGNKLNNDISNLEWVSHSDNMRHAIKIGLWDYFGDNSPKAKITDIDVNSIITRHDNGEPFTSIATDYPVTSRYVSQICNGERRKRTILGRTE